MWCQDGNAGLKFSSLVNVASWLPRGRSVALQRESQGRFSVASEPELVVCDEGARAALTRISRTLEAIAAELAGVEVMLERHPEKLVTLEIAAQQLALIATQRRKEDPPGMPRR
jgi:hypothetical protein